MYNILNSFLLSKYFDKLPKFIARKIFKIFKVFFVETDLKYLPENNHPTKIDEEEQEKIVENINNQFYKPFSTCSFLLETLSICSSYKKHFKLLDFGANNIDNYIYLNRYLKNWEYLYHDLPNYNEYVDKLAKEKKWINFRTIRNVSEINDQVEFAFFGSSVHYISDYKKTLDLLFKKKISYLIFTHTPFFKSEKNFQDIVVKQVNIHPIINHAYLLNYDKFIRYLNENNYEIVSQNKNNFIKHLNFKNFKKFSFLSFLDIIFRYKEN
tara:strand:+ start:6108 stop:6911 length:804 start_codon:yes stop_codon:yes gene_type:complete